MGKSRPAIAPISRGALAIACALLGAIPCLPAPPAVAREFRAELGFGGFSVPGRWVPLTIDCGEGGDRAGGGASVLVLRLGEEGREIGSETFPATEGGRIECPVSIEVGLESIVVRLVSAQGTLAETRIDARSRIFPGHLVLACGLDARSRLAIASCLLPAEPVQAVAMDARDLPTNGLDYDGVSALALEDPGACLSPAQKEALLAWLGMGGSLAVASSLEGEDSFLASLGLAKELSWTRSTYGDLESSSFGLGRVARTRLAISEPRGSDSGAFWKAALSLPLYGLSRRLGAGLAAAWSASEGKADEGSNRARLVMILAVAAWLAATVGALALGGARGGRPKGGSSVASARGAAAWPLAVLSIACLTLVLISPQALDAAFMEGASTRVSALVVPETGQALALASVKNYVPPQALTWLSVRSVVSQPIACLSCGERGGTWSPSRPAPVWEHSLPRAGFSPRRGTEGEIALSAVLGPESLELSTLPRLEGGALPKLPPDGKWPPEVDSRGPLAFFVSSVDRDIQTLSCWTKTPGAAWEVEKGFPSWLEEEERWLRSIMRRAPGAFLVGKGPAPGLGLEVAGGRVRQLCWALPLAGGR